MKSKSDKIRARNRDNSKKSTGPKTEAGKARSAMNATKHGLAGQTIVLPGEDLAAYSALRKRFFGELRPIGILEEQCVETMANKTWLLARAAALQNNIFAQGQIKHAHRTDTPDPRVHTAMTAVHTLTEHINNLDKLSRYEQRHHKMYQDALKSLKQLQSERRESEARTRAIPATSFTTSLLPDSDFESQAPQNPSQPPPPDIPDSPSILLPTGS